MKPRKMHVIESRTGMRQTIERHGIQRHAIRHGIWAGVTALLCAATVFGQAAEDLRLTVGKSIVIDYPTDIRQISTSNPDIIDASPVTTKEILMHGKGLGNATMIVWSRAGDRTFYNITVDLNLDPLRKILRETFPNEDITPDSTRDSIALNGHASNKEVAERAVALAATFGKTVVNNLQLAPPPVEKQILLRVKFAELDRQKEVQYGINMLAAPGGTNIGAATGQFPSSSLTGTIATGVGNTASTGTVTISQALSLFAFNPSLNLGAFVKALQSNNILQILTEPNLVTTNGKEASFLVGGEFPVPILQGGANSGAITVQFREFGIRLRFLPVVTSHNTIKMHLTQEISTLDTANGVTINGFSIPALATKRAETDVELGEGQSFVIAGLLDNRDTYTFSKIPLLSSLPIFGNLFKTKDENKQKTELVVIVTPELTQPLGPNDPKPEIPFPRNFLVRLDPNDFENPTPAKTGKKN
jgi:pilus assembly protein CpaC